ncbi:hypothetical protein ACHQM5_017386 [Ranunculus cassubicifolius]
MRLGQIQPVFKGENEGWEAPTRKQLLVERTKERESDTINPFSSSCGDGSCAYSGLMLGLFEQLLLSQKSAID